MFAMQRRCLQYENRSTYPEAMCGFLSYASVFFLFLSVYFNSVGLMANTAAATTTTIHTSTHNQPTTPSNNMHKDPHLYFIRRAQQQSLSSLSIRLFFKCDDAMSAIRYCACVACAQHCPCALSIGYRRVTRKCHRSPNPRFGPIRLFCLCSITSISLPLEAH